MDQVAEYHKIYKVKTIGDAYFAIAGLPHMTAEGEADDHTFRMFCFGLDCLQLFSGTYLLPDAKIFLDFNADKNILLQRKASQATIGGGDMGAMSRSTSAAKFANSRCPSAVTISGAAPTPSFLGVSRKRTQCPMRYGMNSGQVLVGVLTGKCPAFDVWGKNVNLASRMEVYKWLLKPFELY